MPCANAIQYNLQHKFTQHIASIMSPTDTGRQHTVSWFHGMEQKGFEDKTPLGYNLIVPRLVRILSVRRAVKPGHHQSISPRRPCISMINVSCSKHCSNSLPPPLLQPSVPGFENGDLVVIKQNFS